MNRIWLATVIWIVLLSVPTNAQDINQEIVSNDTTVSTWDIKIGEIVVTSFRIDRKIKELPASVSVLNARDYQKQSSLTLSNVLNSEPGISMGSDGIWATNINIRGMGENRLVTLIDGNRVETANDLTASLSMIDVNDIERVEVIKGAQSSLYGTGAMGGIVNIITKDGYWAAKPYLRGEVFSGFASANTMFSDYAAINAGSGRWYARVSGAYNHAGDIRTPDGVLPNSQFTTNNLSVKFGLKPFSNHIFKIQYQRNRGDDVGIPGGRAFPGPAKATYTDIGRQLLNASYEMKNVSEKLVSLKANYFMQYIVRDVAVEPNTVTESKLVNGNTQRTTPNLLTPSGNHLTHGAQLQSTWALSEKNMLVAGLDAWGRKLTTSREKFITVEILNPQGTVVKTNKMERGEIPIPESIYKTAGLFIQDEFHLMDNRLTLIAGGRLDGVWVENKKGVDVDYLIVNGVRNDSPPTQRVTFAEGNEKSLSWSANAGLLYNLQKNTDLSMNFARSFRAPSLEERFKYIDLGNYVELGNIHLQPESGYSADLGLRVWKTRFNLQSSLFVNRISNMIVESPGQFIYTLTSETEPDTLPALINSNVSKAILYGFDFKLGYTLCKEFVFLMSGSYVRGKDTEANTNLPLIPPLNGRLGIRYSPAKLGSIELTLVGASRQGKIAEGEQATNGYYRVDLALNTSQFDLGLVRLQLFAGIDNLTDKSYTNHLSTNRGSISTEPGRNLFLRMNLSF